MGQDRNARQRLGVVLLGCAFVALALATRLPFRDRTLFISDSVRYALALERYDVPSGRPHPPGNPVYVGIVSLVDRVVQDPPASLAIVSAVASGLALLFAYLLGRDVAGEAAGWLAAGILAVSPLFWFFGSVGMPATSEAALSLLFAWFARRGRGPTERGAFWGMTLVLALAIGFRSTFAVLVAPLWLYAAWRHPGRRIAVGAAVLVLSWLGWSALVAALSGGWSAYGASVQAFLRDVVLATKIFGGGLAKIPRQLFDMGASAVLGLGLFLLPCVVGLFGCLTGRYPFPAAGPFLAAWALPTLAFHSVYDWAPRFGVVLLAPSAVLAASAAVPLARRLLEGRRRADESAPVGPTARALVVFALAANLAVFLWPARLGSVRLPEEFPSGSMLLARNDDLRRRDDAVRELFPDPGSALILAYDHAFHALWFLPEYRVIGLFPLFKDAADAWVPSAHRRTLSFEPGSEAVAVANPLPLPRGSRSLVLFDPDYLAYWPSGALPLREERYDADLGRSLHVAELPGPGCLAFGFRELRFVPAGSGGCEVPEEDLR
jgi:hypothetical protein